MNSTSPTPNSTTKIPSMATTPTSNGTTNDMNYCPPYLLLYSIIFTVIILLTVVGNLFIMIVMNPINRIRRSNIQLLIFYLALFDFLGSVVLTVDIYENVTCFRSWIFGWFGCKTIYSSVDVLLNMSVCILIIMSVDRCRSIMTPLKKKFSRRSIHLAVLVSLLASVVQQWYQYRQWRIRKSGCYVDRMNPLFLIPRIVTTLTRDTTFIIIFTVTSYLVYTSLSRGSLLESYHERKKKENRKVVVMLITMEAVFAVLVIPYDVYHTAMSISRLVPGNHAIAFTNTIYHIDRILSALQMSNCFVNCFIYAKMHRYFGMRTQTVRSSTNRTAAESLKDSRRSTIERVTNELNLLATSM